MGRGLGFTHSEDELIMDNANNMTANELFKLHNEIRQDMLWPERTEKSIARRVERLRELDLIGVRPDDTRRRAYFSRGVSKNLRSL